MEGKFSSYDGRTHVRLKASFRNLVGKLRRIREDLTMTSPLATI